MSEPWKVNSWRIFIVIFTAIFFFTTSSKPGRSFENTFLQQHFILNLRFAVNQQREQFDLTGHNIHRNFPNFPCIQSLIIEQIKK